MLPQQQALPYPFTIQHPVRLAQGCGGSTCSPAGAFSSRLALDRSNPGVRRGRSSSPAPDQQEPGPRLAQKWRAAAWLSRSAESHRKRSTSAYRRW